MARVIQVLGSCGVKYLGCAAFGVSVLRVHLTGLYCEVASLLELERRRRRNSKAPSLRPKHSTLCRVYLAALPVWANHEREFRIMAFGVTC